MGRRVTKVGMVSGCLPGGVEVSEEAGGPERVPGVIRPLEVSEMVGDGSYRGWSRRIKTALLVGGLLPLRGTITLPA